MKIGDRVKITQKDTPNCEGVYFYDLTGRIIGKLDTGVWLVLFDLDVCGLTGLTVCKHNIADLIQQRGCCFSEGGPVNSRNQRFFCERNLVEIKDQMVPQNNDGRNTCFWCGKMTQRIYGFTNWYDFCKECGK